MLLERHDHIELDGVAYRIKNSHRSYITALKIIRSKDIFEEDKPRAVLPLLFEGEIPEGRETDAVIAFFSLFSDSKHKTDRKPSMDIVQDADYIYAGFMQTYHIDLDETDLTIERFIALLKGLPSDTRLAEITRIRTMEIPQRTKFNGKQIADIMSLKREYALTDTQDNGFSSFGKLIKEWARHGG